MKKSLLSLLFWFLVGSGPLLAQYGNEWIQYGQQYFKFKIGKDNIYRIPLSNLFNLGLPASVQGSNLQLFLEGNEIPIFVSNNGTLSGSDYIEFFGEHAKGWKDRVLYQDTSLQLNPDQNLVEDTAVYFITYNNQTNNKRFTPLINDITNHPPKESYVWNHIRNNYRVKFTTGRSANEGNLVDEVHYELNSSQYEGEGWVRSFPTTPDTILANCPNPYKLSGAPSAEFSTSVVGRSYILHEIKIYAGGTSTSGGTLVADSVYNNFEIRRFQFSMPMSSLNTSNNEIIQFVPLTGTGIVDRFGVPYMDYRYPMLPNFGAKSSFIFELNPKSTAYYLEISNFNNASVAPVLYDLSTNEYLLGDIAQSGLVRFLIPASNTVKKLVLQGQQTTAWNSVTALQSVTFHNFTLSSNQGDYLILTHPYYTDDGSGHDYINDYKNYRASALGGGYQPSLAYIDDIQNEFGYGYEYSSLALRNYINYAYSSSGWQPKPKHLFIIGKGLDYANYLNYKSTPPGIFSFVPIPSFGTPGSDLLISDLAKNNRPLLSTGRLTCFNGSDVGIYLQKVKDHEQVLANTVQTTAEKLWQKRILHIAGTSDINEQNQIVSYMNSQSNKVKAPNFGADVTLLKKSSTQEVETINSAKIDELINSGVSYVQFFGHSSSTNIDYGLDFPENYTNYKKYYFFMANGCSAGDVFAFSGQKLLSERFVLAPDRGAIGFIANVNTSFINDLGIFTDSLYSQFSIKNYGKTIGEQMQQNVFTLMGYPSFANDFLFSIHTHQIQLNGDPAVKMYNFPLPDYAVEESDVQFEQFNLNSGLDSVDVDFQIHNLGRFTKDSVNVLVTRRFPDNSEVVVMNTLLPAYSNTDSFHVRVATLGSKAVGLNYFDIKIDPSNAVNEISESNNNLTLPFTIYDDDVQPLYPYDFSIVSLQDVELKGSTLNPFAQERHYILQIDTTELFNSPKLKTTDILSNGGVIKWKPGMVMTDSTVYYWRAAMDTLYGNHTHRWTTFSFIYLNQSPPGWNQSHYYQWKKDHYTDLYIDSFARDFRFVGENRKLQVQCVCMNGPAPFNYDFPDYFVKQNGATMYTHGCSSLGYGDLQFIVIDTITGKAWDNYRPVKSIALGRFGSFAPCRGPGIDSNKVNPFFEFSFLTVDFRKKVMDFLDSIPQGTYLMMQTRLCDGNACGGVNKTFIHDWKADTTLYGSGQSLYHKLFNLGFTGIDSLYKNRPMIFWQKKGIPSTVVQYIGIDSTQKLVAEFDYNSLLYQGDIHSTKIGPAKAWGSFLKQSYTTDTQPGDSTRYTITVIDKQGNETILDTLQGDTTLAHINANQYPYLRVAMMQRDNVNQTPEQLHYWRVLYDPIPEAALNAHAFLSFKDSVGQGEINPIGIALENLTPIGMDSMLVRYTLIDRNANKINLGDIRYKPLIGNDTLHISRNLDATAYPGNNTLVIEANPDEDQSEQFHPNNIAIRSFYVTPDKQNPFLDVTFDGVHILDKDIVSPKPQIQITLQDDNKFLALDDSTLVDVFLKLPGDTSTFQRIPYDGQVLKFIPAVAGNLQKKNQCRIEYRPTFNLNGDDYMLSVKAHDRTMNEAGQNAYKVGFEVVNESSITSVLNYPNPFTTSTQFVFTLTGSELPTNMKIQIMTTTGKVVREILQSELGPLHIGRNITTFRWTGDDQYGKPLGNGVYLYRVVTNLHGSNMEHRASGADTWMEKGFGKLYIMR